MDPPESRRVVRVLARARVNPSEEPAKVRAAVTALFPAAPIREGDGWIELETDSLESLRNLIWKQKILDAARRSLLHSLDESGTRAVFELSKQAAFAGKLSFAVEESPLGDVVVAVEGEDLESQFKAIAPMTVKGIPLSEEAAERHLEKMRKRKASLREPKERLDAVEAWEETE